VNFALQYVFSDRTIRTIQNRIKNLGFKWIPKERKYQFVGADESVYDRITDDVFKSENAINNKFDNIDRLLAGKKVKRIYRGFYFDGDVLNIIDRKAYFKKSSHVKG
jgi:hypothetical protein